MAEEEQQEIKKIEGNQWVWYVVVFGFLFIFASVFFFCMFKGSGGNVLTSFSVLG